MCTIIQYHFRDSEMGRIVSSRMRKRSFLQTRKIQANEYSPKLLICCLQCFKYCYEPAGYTC
ncbi:hypothetical protein Hanom_Chr12g01131821 [Helianthus anomalus]